MSAEVSHVPYETLRDVLYSNGRVSESFDRRFGARNPSVLRALNKWNSSAVLAAVIGQLIQPRDNVAAVKEASDLFSMIAEQDLEAAKASRMILPRGQYDILRGLEHLLDDTDTVYAPAVQEAYQIAHFAIVHFDEEPLSEAS